MPELPTGTVTFLFTDIEGSTRLWEQYPKQMRLALARHDTILRQAIEANNGYLFKTAGDAFCAAFATTRHALEAARAAQLALQEAYRGHDTDTEEKPKPLAPEQPDETYTKEASVPPASALSAVNLRVRMALHTGTAEYRNSDYFGQSLNRTARLLIIGHGGQVLISQAAREFLLSGVTLKDMGVHRLKDLQHPEHVYQLLDPHLPADFPPLRSLQAFANNLPIQMTSFIGRQKEIAEVKELLTKTHLFTLTGTGGCGKTRLALQVGADLLEEYEDGVWLVELGSLVDASLVPGAVAAALGLQEETGRPLIKTLIDYLKPKNLLLILDNCEHLLAATAQLADDLLRGCPRIRILASSREPMGIQGEQTYRVPSLSLPDPKHLPPLEVLNRFEAVALFIDRASLNQPNFAVTGHNMSAIAQLCHRLDGIPLAIELAAARIKALSVEQVVARLDDRFRLFTGGSRTALPRHQTLRALVAWSYDLLSEVEQRLFRRLAVFAGGWTLETAEAVCSSDDIQDKPYIQSGSEDQDIQIPQYLNADEVLNLLTSLVDKSLVAYEQQERQSRYRLPETVRQYAYERLIESGEEAVFRDRHRDYFLQLAEEADRNLQGSEQAIWLDRLETEHDNLRAALEWSKTEGGGGQTGLRLVGQLGGFWLARGYLSEGRKHYADILAQHDAQDPTPQRAKALNMAGDLALFQNDLMVARSLYEESLLIWRELRLKREIADTLNKLGMVASSQSDYASAHALLEESEKHWRELGDKASIAQALHYQGIVAEYEGRYSWASTFYEQSLQLWRELGNQNLVAWGLHGLGFLACLQQDFATARAFLEESATIFREAEDRPGLARSLERFAGLAVAQHRMQRAARLYGAAESLRETIGWPLPSQGQQEYDRDIAAIRAELGDEALAAAWSTGRSMKQEQAVDYALDVAEA